MGSYYVNLALSIACSTMSGIVDTNKWLLNKTKLKCVELNFGSQIIVSCLNSHCLGLRNIKYILLWV